MIVGFDVTWMDKDNKSGGIYQYALRLIFALVVHTNIKVIAITGCAGKGIFDGLKERENFREVLLTPSNSLFDIVISEKIDVVHTPAQSFQNLTFSIPLITTLHDLQHFHFPDFFSREEITVRNFFYKLSAEFAERVIVSFQHVKDDIVKFYEIPAEKIDVCPLGMPALRLIDQSRFPEIKKKYRLPDKYLFYSANAWRHKNHIGLIRALKILHEKHGLKISLVCTGQKNPDFYPEIKGAIKSLNLSGFVNFTGYIPEDDVRLLLKNATLVVIPTLYEAGSFPLMEAMIYEVPVICSNVTSLPDAIGNKRFIFDPKDIGQVAEKAAMMLKDEKLIAENRENSRKRTKEGGWEKSVHCFVNTYQKAIKDFREEKDSRSLRLRMRNYEILSMRINKDKNLIYNSLSCRISVLLRSVSRFLAKFTKKTV